MTTKEDTRCRKCSGMRIAEDGTRVCGLHDGGPVPIGDIPDNECPLDEDN